MPSPDDLRELAPTGTLRGGVVVSPAPSAFFAIRDSKGEVQGVTIDLLRDGQHERRHAVIADSLPEAPARGPSGSPARRPH